MFSRFLPTRSRWRCPSIHPTSWFCRRNRLSETYLMFRKRLVETDSSWSRSYIYFLHFSVTVGYTGLCVQCIKVLDPGSVTAWEGGVSVGSLTVNAAKTYWLQLRREDSCVVVTSNYVIPSGVSGEPTSAEDANRFHWLSTTATLMQLIHTDNEALGHSDTSALII